MMGEKGHLGSKADAIQKAKEYNWIAKNILKSETPEQERKWRKKMDNWRKANPKYAELIDREMMKELIRREKGLTKGEAIQKIKEYEDELKRRESVMK